MMIFYIVYASILYCAFIRILRTYIMVQNSIFYFIAIYKWHNIDHYFCKNNMERNAI